jgi:arsenite-transporting ATPase
VSPRARRPADALLDSLPRLTLVAGKGGVGKTTCAAALALHATRRPGRTLLLSTDPAGTLGDALGVALGSDPCPIELPAIRRGAARGSLEALQLDAPAERRRFLDRWRDTIVTIIDRGTYLDLEDITGLVDAALPGADEIFAVLRLGELERSAVYDRVIVDTAPTGHTLRLLDLPRTFAATIELLEAMQAKHRFMVRSLTRAYRSDTADAFLDQLRRQTAALIGALRDPECTAALLVTRSEPLVVAETQRYAADLTSTGIRIAAVVVNAAAGNGVELFEVDAPQYRVPLLSEPPIGPAGLLPWTDALTDRVRTRATPSRTTRSGSAATAAAGGPKARADELLFPSLTIVGGKGGVGKTTAACALAIAAAAATPEVLLVSTDPAPSIGDALQQPIGDRETAVEGVRGLVARQMDATAAFAEFQRGYQDRVDALFDNLVGRGIDARHDREILRELLALAPPGIDELYALASLGVTLDEHRFARVIVDPSPTGHLLRLLQMPPLALDWSHRLMRLMLKYREVGGLGESAHDVLAFARRTRRVGEILRDPRHAGMVIITLDEPLVRGETARLISAARGEGVAVGAVLWNRWPGRTLPVPLPADPPVPQFVAPAVAPPPVGPTALRAWAGQWREALDGDG